MEESTGVIENSAALFCCTLCDEDCDDSGAKSDQFDKITEHIRNKHNVTNLEGIQLNVKIPPTELLCKYRCMLCTEEFISITGDRLIHSHFQAFHQTRNVKPKQIRRICRICGHEKNSSNAELVKHIEEAHPRDLFADDDDDDENDHVANTNSAAVEKLPVPMPVQVEALAPVSVVPAPATSPPKPVAAPEDFQPPLGASAPSKATAAAVAPNLSQQFQSAGIDQHALKENDIEELLSTLNKPAEMKKRSHSTSSSSSSSSTSSTSSSSDSSEQERRRRKKKKKRAKKKKAKVKRASRKAMKRSVTMQALEVLSKEVAGAKESENSGDDEDRLVEKAEQMVEQMTSVQKLWTNREETKPVAPMSLRVEPLLAAKRLLPDAAPVFQENLEDGEVSPSWSVREREAAEESFNSVLHGSSRRRDSPHGGRRSKSRSGSPRQRKTSRSRASSREDTPPKSYRKVTLQPKRSHDREKSPYDRSGRRSRSASPDQRRGDDEEFYCHECKVTFTEGTAYDHYQSRNHNYHTRNKVRCFLCSRYVSSAKNHFEECHAKDIFQCKLKCHNPKSLDFLKILSHMRKTHASLIRKKSNEELFRRSMVSLPAVLSSYRCHICRRVFVGQTEEKVLQHIRHEDGIRNPRSRDISYSCRICGPRKYFDSDSQLQRHARDHRDHILGGDTSRSRSRSRSRDGHRSRSTSSQSRSRYDSRSRSRSWSRSPQRPSYSRARELSASTAAGTGDRKRNYVKCGYCFQVTERNKSDILEHQLKNHRDFLFHCTLCSFKGITMRIVYNHLREEHSDAGLDTTGYGAHKLMKLPSDLRTIFCGICSDDASRQPIDPTDDPYFWSCQSLLETKHSLGVHLKEKHGGNLTIGNTFRLGCRACVKEFFFNEEEEWRNHLRKDHQDLLESRDVNRRSRSRSETPDRMNGGRFHGRSSPKGEAGSASSSDEDGDATETTRSRGSGRGGGGGAGNVNFCAYCCVDIDGGLLSHIQDKHWREVFRCRICPETRLQPFQNEPELAQHMSSQHRGDKRFDVWKTWVDYPEELRCIKCKLCANPSKQHFYGVSAETVRASHFGKEHDGTDFQPGLLEFMCRICMMPGIYNNEQELADHLQAAHRKSALTNPAGVYNMVQASA